MQGTSNNPNACEKKYMSIAETSAYTGLSSPYVYTLAHKSGFPAVRVGRRILIDRAKLDIWIADQNRAG